MWRCWCFTGASTGADVHRELDVHEADVATLMTPRWCAFITQARVRTRVSGAVDNENKNMTS